MNRLTTHDLEGKYVTIVLPLDANSHYGEYLCGPLAEDALRRFSGPIVRCIELPTTGTPLEAGYTLTIPRLLDGVSHIYDEMPEEFGASYEDHLAEIHRRRMKEALKVTLRNLLDLKEDLAESAEFRMRVRRNFPSLPLTDEEVKMGDIIAWLEAQTKDCPSDEECGS